MKSQSDDKETLSRRGFTKSVAAALAAIPFASSLANAQRRRRRRRTGTQGTQPPIQKVPEAALVVDRDRNEHDTPPPLLIANGSLLVETVAAFDLIEDSGTMKKHHIQAKGMTNGQPNEKIFPAHVKILDGSGEMLYRYDFNPRDMPGAYKFQLTATLTNSATLTVNSSSLIASRRNLVITTGPDRKVIPRPPSDDPLGLDKPQGNVRTVRHRLARNDATFLDTHKIEIITITRDFVPQTNPPVPSDVIYSVDVANHKAGRELRIMIWLEEEL